MLVGSHGLGHLVAHAVDGVERRHRVLKDHGDLRPADLAQLVLRPSQEVPALEADRPGDLCRLGQQAHHGHGAHRFARTRLADDAKNLALRQAITHAPHGLDEPVVGRELDRQILDGENSVSGPAIGSVDVGGGVCVVVCERIGAGEVDLGPV